MIPLSEPYLGKADRARVSKALRSGWLTQAGKEVRIMENILAEFYGLTESSEHSVTATSNGTTALHLALLSLDVGKGDEVIIPNFAYIAVANAILYVGATPVVVDVDPKSWNISKDEIQKKISHKTKAVIVVDNYGHLNHYEELRTVIPSRITIIQDAAESFPGNNHDKFKSNFGDIVTLSFYANKVITAGEGGAVVAPHSIIKRINYLKNQAQIDGANFNHGEVGFNYRISNLHAAVFNAQWSKLNTIEHRRRSVFSHYYKALNNANIEFSTNDCNDSAKWLFTISLLDLQFPIKDLRTGLAERGIESRPGFTPFSNIDYLKKVSKMDKVYPNSDLLAKTVISLPTYPRLKYEQIDFIVETMSTVLHNVE
jgi:perosamine synthetase